MSDIPRFERPYDWNAIDKAVLEFGGVIAEGALTPDEVEPLNREIDAYLGEAPDIGLPGTGSSLYDTFLGHDTLRLHGLIEKIPSSAALIGRAEFIDWAERLIGPLATSVLPALASHRTNRSTACRNACPWCASYSSCSATTKTMLRRVSLTNSTCVGPRSACRQPVPPRWSRFISPAKVC